MKLPRTTAQIRRFLRALVTILCFALFGALAFIIGAFIHSLGSIAIGSLAAMFHVSIFFAILGAIFGTVLALDRSADVPPFLQRSLRRFEAPATRTVICAVLGGLATVVVRSWHPGIFPIAWLFVGTIAGAVLGWYGWRWAKYVDF
jgi:hypothetical protein